MTDILDYIGISIAGLVAGAIAGGIGGLSVGWLLAFTYQRRGLSVTNDAPVYVAIGLTLVGSCLGALAGFIVGMIHSLRLAKKRKSLH